MAAISATAGYVAIENCILEIQQFDRRADGDITAVLTTSYDSYDSHSTWVEHFEEYGYASLGRTNLSPNDIVTLDEALKMLGILVSEVAVAVKNAALHVG